MKKPILIPVYLNLQASFSNDNSDAIYAALTAKDRELLRWLNEHVGITIGIGTRMPIKGDGWMLTVGYDEDSDIEDYNWRCRTYKGKGKKSTWLVLYDDMLAVELKLSGVLDDRPVDPILAMIDDLLLSLRQSPINQQHLTILKGRQAGIGGVQNAPFIMIDSLSELLAPNSPEVKQNIRFPLTGKLKNK